MQRKVAVQLLALVVAIGCGREADSGRGSTRHAGNTTVAAQPLVVTGETDVAEEYVYDGGGNLVETRSTATAALVAITDFSPHAGGTGQVVVVDGTGFSALPSHNTVTLNGQMVSVNAASPHQLSFVVPAGASTGRISVTTAGQTAASATDFTVLEGVVVTDFEPKFGKAGTAVTVTGANFDPDPVGDQVKIGGGAAVVLSASDTTLAVTVGPSASSGKVSVTARGLTGTSDADFYLVPGALSEAAIEFTGRLIVGVAARVTIGTPGNAGLLLFDG